MHSTKRKSASAGSGRTTGPVRWGLVALVAVLLGGGFSSAFAQQPTGVLKSLEQDIAYLLQKVKPYVVTVTGRTYRVIVAPEQSNKKLLSFLHESDQDKLRRPVTETVCNVGSGLIYDERGDVITKSSIVQDAEEIVVTLMDGRQVPATYLGSDVRTGLAVVRMAPDGYAVPEFSDGKTLPGAWLTIVGNSMGVSPSVSVGLVNGIRSDGLIQVSTTVSPGSIGSPVFDSEGRVAGMLAACLEANSSDDSGLGGAMAGGALVYPAPMVRSIVEGILSKGRVPEGWLGFTLEAADSGAPGPRVVRVVENGPADLAGIRPGDFVVRVGTLRVSNLEELMQQLSRARPGQVLDLTVLRGQRVIRALVQVSERPPHRPVGVEVESECEGPGKTRTALGLRQAATGRDHAFGRTMSRGDIQRRIQKLEREIKKLKAQIKQ
ncbi:MAG TPA: serine protease [Bacteroidetes bacterium]|nr:serine protease [Bacteroidota bacterium]